MHGLFLKWPRVRGVHTPRSAVFPTALGTALAHGKHPINVKSIVFKFAVSGTSYFISTKSPRADSAETSRLPRAAPLPAGGRDRV